MKQPKKVKEHPEIQNTKNICDVSPGTKTTKDVCDVVKEKKPKKSS
jgi:hypothetical protein